MIPSGYRVRRVVRRYTYITSDEQRDPLNRAVKLTNKGVDYPIFISSDRTWCFSHEPSDLQTTERDVGQNNPLVPDVKTARKGNTDVGDVENPDKDEESVPRIRKITDRDIKQ